MRTSYLPFFAWITILTSVGFLGCSGSGRTVSGEVKLDGKPLAGAEIRFSAGATSGMGGFDGKTDEEGKFKIPITSDLVKAGKYRVMISKYVDKKGKPLDPEEMEQLKAAGKLKNIVPSKYNDPDESILIVDITDGNNVLPPFELKSK